MDEIRPIVKLPPGGITSENIHVVWPPEPTPLSKEARHRIDQTWTACLAEAQKLGKNLFNAPIIRFLSASFQDSRLELHLGPSDYKSFIVTCLRDRPWFLANAPAAIAPGLGNSALITHKNEALLGIRSAKVHAYANRAHVIGGVLEPAPSPSTPDTTALLSHLAKEVQEELHLSTHAFAAAPRLLAFMHEEFLGQPELTWQWETREPLVKLKATLDPAEHSDLIILRKDSVDEQTHARMTPLARAAVRAWQQQ